MNTHSLSIAVRGVALLSLLGGLLLAPLSVGAATYYVRPDGSDANAGTAPDAAQAFGSIQAAADIALPGDTIYVAQGSYNVERLVPAYSGTSSQPIRFLGDPTGSQFPDLTGGAVQLSSAGTQSWYWSDRDYIQISHFEMVSGGYQAFMLGGDGIEISHNTIHGYGASGIMTYAGADADDWVIHGNEIYDCGTAGINVYKHGAGNWTISNNIIHDIDGVGIRRYNGGIGIDVDGLTILNNTVFNTPSGAVEISADTTGVVMYNNIFDGDVLSQVSAVEDYNCITGILSGITPGAHSINSDPLLDSNSAPTSKSVINNGDNARVTWSEDILGAIRIRHGIVDMGAVEAEGLLGDADLDWIVAQSDLDILLGNYEQWGSFGWTDGDFNYDGKVDITDMNLLLSHFGTDLSQQSTIPEPLTAAVLLLGGAGLLGRRRRRH